jgi:hypothetical protein
MRNHQQQQSPCSNINQPNSISKIQAPRSTSTSTQHQQQHQQQSQHQPQAQTTTPVEPQRNLLQQEHTNSRNENSIVFTKQGNQRRYQNRSEKIATAPIL